MPRDLEKFALDPSWAQREAVKLYKDTFSAALVGHRVHQFDIAVGDFLPAIERAATRADAMVQKKRVQLDAVMRQVALAPIQLAGAASIGLGRSLWRLAGALEWRQKIEGARDEFPRVVALSKAVEEAWGYPCDEVVSTLWKVGNEI